MSDNYVHCTMLFELILSLLLQSKETFCHLLVKCCQLLLLVICRSTNRIPLCNKCLISSVLDTSHTIIWTLREAMRYLSSDVYACPQVLVLHQFLPFVSCFSFSYCSFFWVKYCVYLDLALRAASTIACVMLIFVTPLTCKMWCLITLLATNDCSC